MRNWIGAASLLAGVWLIYLALAHRRRVLAARHAAAVRCQGDESDTLHPSLVGMGIILRPIILAALALIGIQTVLAYVSLEGRVFSLFDLLGFLFLLASYGVWIVFKINYRGLG